MIKSLYLMVRRYFCLIIVYRLKTLCSCSVRIFLTRGDSLVSTITSRAVDKWLDLPCPISWGNLILWRVLISVIN